MLKKKTLYTGIHPPHYEKISKEKEIITAPPGEYVYIPLSQHIGAPAKPTVKPGDTVQAGDLIGEKNGFISANIHSSVSGTVSEIIPHLTANGMISDTVIIKVTSENETKIRHENDYHKLSAQQILSKIEQAGIVGMGGATFPTNVKLSPPPDKKIDTLIINGVECESYLTCDYRLMIEKIEDLITGIRILQKVLPVKNTIIGIEVNKIKAINLFDKFLKDDASIKVAPFSVKYPQGAEKQLIFMATGRQVPSGGLPMDIGCVVSNIATVHAIKKAVIHDLPLIERIVTFSGRALKSPVNKRVKIGTLLSDLITENDFKINPIKIISGGPMMGFPLTTLDIPITKGTSGFLFLTSEDTSIKKEYNCISCGRCLSVCPAGLQPTMLLRLSENMQYSNMKEHNLLDCIECGSCSFICPSSKPIVQKLKVAKQMARQEKDFSVYTLNP